MKSMIIERHGIPFRCEYELAYKYDPDDCNNLEELEIFIGDVNVTDFLFHCVSETYYWLDSEVIERLAEFDSTNKEE